MMPRTCHLCEHRIRKNQRTDLHHLKPKSEGGTRVVIVHQRCHVRHHSQNNHFARWGRFGGKTTAAKGYWIRNLKRGAKKPDPNTPINQ